MDEQLITVFTPTYNRAHTLNNLYESLKRQTSKSFEWIIVDDGSVDMTESLVSEWEKNDNSFPIKYIKKVNEGKHIAINVGVEQANGDWFLIVDSDDFLYNDAIEKVVKWTYDIKNDNIAAVSGTKCFKNGSIIGADIKFDDGFIDCRNNERNKFGLTGDKAEVYKTKILKEFPFPKFEKEKFLSEGAVWDLIAYNGYMIRWYNQPLMVCEYLEDGLTSKLTNNDLELNNFIGYTYYTRIQLKVYRGIEKFRISKKYVRIAKRKGMSLLAISKTIEINLFYVFLLNFYNILKNNK